ncbi:peptidyl-prolyl cis-trans isomerase-like 4 [Holotrichia oblita]|uniref:Peptidyl-prolyl cis-trans isomerase-like 4 n=1 Tax=Holotrichia oblita TaxID=644536 RepID=A0ACB9SMN5_HOLOL|nr:peptidyl-prolyl cis-trans isomerase-like 4 [Holotrichia oblita]
MEGLDVLELLNEVICDQDNRPYQDVRITHTVVLDDPFPDPEYLRVPPRSPSPNAERLQGGRIAPDEEIDESQGKSLEEVNEIVAFKEAKARATILEMIGDIPDAEMAPPENVLFVCKLNPVTTDDDLEIIFSRFGKINSCEVIRDKKTDESLQYAFVEFDDRKACEDAYFKMDNVLIDDRRIHVDFSQSVAKVKWHGKGRGVTTYNDKGKKIADSKNDIGNGRYKRAPNNSDKQENYQRNRYVEDKKYSREDRGDYRSHSRNRSYDRREQFNEYKKYDTGQTYSRKYDKYKSGIRQDERSKERDDYNKTRYSSRSFEKFDKKDTKGLSQRSRSHSYDKYKDKKEDYTRSKREKYEPKKAKSSHSSTRNRRRNDQIKETNLCKGRFVSFDFIIGPTKDDSNKIPDIMNRLLIKRAHDTSSRSEKTPHDSTPYFSNPTAIKRGTNFNDQIGGWDQDQSIFQNTDIPSSLYDTDQMDDKSIAEYEKGYRYGTNKDKLDEALENAVLKSELYGDPASINQYRYYGGVADDKRRKRRDGQKMRFDTRIKREVDLSPEDILALLSLMESERQHPSNYRNWQRYDPNLDLEKEPQDSYEDEDEGTWLDAPVYPHMSTHSNALPAPSYYYEKPQSYEKHSQWNDVPESKKKRFMVSKNGTTPLAN